MGATAWGRRCHGRAVPTRRRSARGRSAPAPRAPEARRRAPARAGAARPGADGGAAAAAGLARRRPSEYASRHIDLLPVTKGHGPHDAHRRAPRRARPATRRPPSMRAMRHWPVGALSLVHLNVLSTSTRDGPLPMRGLAEALDVSPGQRDRHRRPDGAARPRRAAARRRGPPRRPRRAHRRGPQPHRGHGRRAAGAPRHDPRRRSPTRSSTASCAARRAMRRARERLHATSTPRRTPRRRLSRAR